MNRRIAILSSTGGSVIRTVLSNSSVNFDLIITDRDCGCCKVSEDFGIDHETVIEADPLVFSDKLLKVLRDRKIDFVMVFFTRLLKGNLLLEYKYRLINFHPSLLPSCPGINGFEDSIKSGSLMIGSTVHCIDRGVDTGCQLIQVACSVNGRTKDELRHIVFSQQCASLLDITLSIQREELQMTELGPKLINRKFEDSNFSYPVFKEDSNKLYFKLIES